MTSNFWPFCHWMLILQTCATMPNFVWCLEQKERPHTCKASTALSELSSQTPSQHHSYPNPRPLWPSLLRFLFLQVGKYCKFQWYRRLLLRWPADTLILSLLALSQYWGSHCPYLNPEGGFWHLPLIHTHVRAHTYIHTYTHTFNAVFKYAYPSSLAPQPWSNLLPGWPWRDT